MAMSPRSASSAGTSRWLSECGEALSGNPKTDVPTRLSLVIDAPIKRRNDPILHLPEARTEHRSRAYFHAQPILDEEEKRFNSSNIVRRKHLRYPLIFGQSKFWL